MFQDFDPFAEHRVPKIADREDEYRARRRQMIISPDRHDPFADGKFSLPYAVHLNYPIDEIIIIM